MITNIMRVKNPPPGMHSSQEWADKQANPSVAYPGVFEVTGSPASGTTSHRIKAAWWEYTRKINELMGTLDGWNAARRVNAGWINAAANPEYVPGSYVPADPKADQLPIVEGVITIHNYVEVIEKFNQSARIKIFDYLQAPPDLSAVNPFTNPELFDLFRSVNKAGDLGYAPDGKKFYFPRLAKNGIGWLPLEILEPATLPIHMEDDMAVPQTHAQGVDFKGEYAQSYDPLKKPADFIVQQITQGLAIDPLVDQIRAQIEPVPVKLAYHYHRFAVGWKQQADNFLSVYKPRKYHGVGWDYEKDKNPTLDAKTDAELKAAMDYVRQETGQKVLLYTQLSVLNDMLRRGATWVLTVDLWIARWFSTSYYASGAAVNAAAAWPKWADDRLREPVANAAIWQFGGDYRHPTEGWFIPGYKQGRAYGVNQDSIDLDAFRGTLAEMYAWLKMADEPVPPLEPTPLTMEEKVALLFENAKAHPPQGWVL